VAEVHVVELQTVLLISHDASRTGAPRCLLELAQMLQANSKQVVEIATCGGGDFLSDFARVAPLTRLPSGGAEAIEAAEALLLRFTRSNPNGIILVNTVVPIGVYRALENLGIRNAIAWLHELPVTIDQCFGGASTIELIQRVTRKIVVPS